MAQHAFLAKVVDDPNTYLINDAADQLQRSLTSLELTDVLGAGPLLDAPAPIVSALGAIANLTHS